MSVNTTSATRKAGKHRYRYHRRRHIIVTAILLLIIGFMSCILIGKEVKYFDFYLFDYNMIDKQGNDDAETDAETDQSSSAKITKKKKKMKYALAQFLDEGDGNLMENLYGTYSIITQVEKFNMTGSRYYTFDHVVVIDGNNTPQNVKQLLYDWLGGQRYVIEVDTRYILGKFPTFKKGHGIWEGVFNMLNLFNLTQYDKVIKMDNDILIRTNIMHWLDQSRYPVDSMHPCGTQQGVDIAWNAGAMVIVPNTTIFEDFVSIIPALQGRYDKSHIYEKDPNTMGFGHQAFLTSYFTKDYNNGGKDRCIMPVENSMLSSYINDQMKKDEYNYLYKWRKDNIQTIHFTTNKPWLRYAGDPREKNPAVCDFLKEWQDSVHGIESYIYNRIFPPESKCIKKQKTNVSVFAGRFNKLNALLANPTSGPAIHNDGDGESERDNNNNNNNNKDDGDNNNEDEDECIEDDDFYSTIEEKIQRDKNRTLYLVKKNYHGNDPNNQLKEYYKLFERGGILTLQPEYYLSGCDRYADNNTELNTKFLAGKDIWYDDDDDDDNDNDNDNDDNDNDIDDIDDIDNTDNDDNDDNDGIK